MLPASTRLQLSQNCFMEGLCAGSRVSSMRTLRLKMPSFLLLDDDRLAPSHGSCAPFRPSIWSIICTYHAQYSLYCRIFHWGMLGTVGSRLQYEQSCCDKQQARHETWLSRAVRMLTFVSVAPRGTERMRFWVQKYAAVVANTISHLRLDAAGYFEVIVLTTSTE